MNWSDALDKTIKEYEAKTLAYGVSDCCQFASRYLQHKNGGPSLADRFFSYSGKDGASEAIAKCGSLSDVVAICLGAPTPGKPELGDVVVLSADVGETAAIYAGDDFVFVHVAAQEVVRTQGAVVARWSK